MRKTLLILPVAALVAAVLAVVIVMNREIPPGSAWESTSTPELSWRYPPDFGTGYVSPTDWPPTISRLSGEAYSCTNTGSETDRAGRTEEISVRGRTYCKTVVTGAAAGSMYRQYAYLGPRKGPVLAVTFTARFPQCANYDEPRMTDCLKDQSSFDPDQLADSVVQTAVFK